MAQKAHEREAIAEEYSRLDAELKQLQHEFADTRSLNDELAKAILEKEEELLVKDKRLENLREKNLADSEQLDLELLTVTEKYEYEISTKEEIVKKLEIQYRRFQELQKENYELRVSVQAQSDLMENNRNEHAIKMHEKNLEMKHLREDMEKKMRDQLNKMDISYQKDAFAALSERHKKAMFQNAKLKDEVALQGVGLNNLGSRLAKQTQQYDVCNRELKSMNKRLRVLKEKLATISSDKIEIARRKEEVLTDEAELVKERKDLTLSLEAEPRVPECERLREQLHIQILDTKCDVTMWTYRLNKLRDLNLNLKPVYVFEQEGRFNPLTFPLEASQSLYSMVHRSAGSRVHTASSHGAASPTGSFHSRDHSPERTETPHVHPHAAMPATGSHIFSGPIIAHGSGLHATTEGSLVGDSAVESQSAVSQVVSMALKPTDIAELVEQDASLAAALAPLRGKESTLLTVMPEDEEKKELKWPSTESKSAKMSGPPRDQNMIAWVTLKIVDIWEESRMENERLKEQKFKLLDHLLKTLHADGAMAALTSFGAEQRSMKSASSPACLTAHTSGVQSVYSTQSSPSNHLSAIQESEQSSQTQFPTEGFSGAKNYTESRDMQNESNLSQAAEMMDLLASGAQQILTLPPLRNTTRQVEVPLLPIKHASENSLDPRGGVLHTTKQQERDWIESGDLGEEHIASLWDEAFSMPPSASQYGMSEVPVTTWLQRVPAAKRYPTTVLHMEDTPTYSPAKKSLLGSKSKKGLHESREGFAVHAEGDGSVSVSVASMLSLPPKTLTAKLLCQDIHQLTANYNVGPPVMIDRGNDRSAERNLDMPMQRSGTLPQLSFSLTPNRELHTPLHERVEDSGLKVTEEGLLLKDPLMGKKFAQTQKQVVKNALKQSAALKKTAELQMKKAKSEAAIAHGIDPLYAMSVKIRKDKVHSMSSNLIHHKS